LIGVPWQVTHQATCSCTYSGKVSAIIRGAH
jgi:hypothetical protein